MSSFRRGAYAIVACVRRCSSSRVTRRTTTRPRLRRRGIPPLDQPAGGAAKAPSDHPVHPPTRRLTRRTTQPAAAGTSAGAARDTPAMGAAGAAPSGAFAGTTPGGEFDPKTVLVGRHQGRRQGEGQGRGGRHHLRGRAPVRRGRHRRRARRSRCKKLTAGTWPLKFALDSRDAMFAGTSMSGQGHRHGARRQGRRRHHQEPGRRDRAVEAGRAAEEGRRRLAGQGAVMKGLVGDIVGARGAVPAVRGRAWSLSLVIGMVLAAHLDGPGGLLDRHGHLRRGPARRRGRARKRCATT